MSVAVLVPYRAQGCTWRERARIHVRAHYARELPDWQWVEGTCDGDWSKGLAVADALTRTDADTLVISDADCLVPADALRGAVESLAGAGWAVPHTRVYRLSQGATEALYAGQKVRDWDRNPYRGVPGGGVAVLTRETYERCPIDPRFRGWGGEDVAWGRALNTLVGPGWRSTADLTHLWHPTARVGHVGAPESVALLQRWILAARRGGKSLDAMLEDAREALCLTR